MQASLTGSSEAIKELRKYEPNLYKEFRAKLKSELNPIIKPVQSDINSQVTTELQSTMPGMFHGGRSAWTGANINVSVTSNPKNLISIIGSGRSSKVGFNYAELAGIERRPPRSLSRAYTINGEPRRHRVNGQGLAFNDKLRREFGKPGRFMWIRIVKQKNRIENGVEQVAESYNVKVNRRLA